MKIDYQSNKLKKQLSDASEIKRAFGEHARKVAQRMAEMKAAPDLAVLQQILAARCHALKGDRAGQWAVNISPNHRLIFEIATNPIPMNDDKSINTTQVTAILIVATTDYH